MKIIGHRGARGLVPENTIESLLRAMEHQVDIIEFDVRVSADHIPILVHDEFVQDSEGKKLKVAKTNLSELRAANHDLALLDEAFSAIEHQKPFIIDVKPGVELQPIVDLIKNKLLNGWNTEEIILGSFSQKILRQLHTALPELQTNVIERWSGVRAHYRARQVNAKILSMNQRWLWWGFILGFKNSDYQLYAYTLNVPKKAQRWAKYGLAGTITDYPDRFKN